jgi:hypothetical protein
MDRYAVDTDCALLREQADALNVFATFALRIEMDGTNSSEGTAAHHDVYVVLLSDAVAKHRSILRLNPKRDPLNGARAFDSRSLAAAGNGGA